MGRRNFKQITENYLEQFFSSGQDFYEILETSQQKNNLGSRTDFNEIIKISHQKIAPHYD